MSSIFLGVFESSLLVLLCVPLNFFIHFVVAFTRDADLILKYLKWFGM